MLRALAESRVKWAFWPHGHITQSVDTNQGIWVNSGATEDSDEDDSEVEDEDDQEVEDGSGSGDNGIEEESEWEFLGIGIAAGGGRFGALALADGERGRGRRRRPLTWVYILIISYYMFSECTLNVLKSRVIVKGRQFEERNEKSSLSCSV